MDATKIYSERADAYARCRPAYPLAIVNTLRAIQGKTKWDRIADVGSGTGNFTALLLASGTEVFAIEPNGQMRALAEKRFATASGFHSIAATAEATSLPANHVDLVTIGQALHWFDTDRAKVEFQRILRGGKRVVVVWNQRSQTCNAFHRKLDKTLRTACPTYRMVREIDAHFGQVLKRFFAKGQYDTSIVPNHQVLSESDFIDRFQSSSFAPLPGSPDYQNFSEVLVNLHRQFSRDRRVNLKYDTWICWGTL